MIRIENNTKIPSPQVINEKTLADEWLLKIFFHLNSCDLYNCSLVNKKWHKLSHDTSLLGEIFYRERVFGKEQWTQYYGEVGNVPDFPPNIKDILSAECLLFPGKRIGKTHILVLVPEKVNGQLLTIKSLKKLADKGSNGYRSWYRYVSNYVTKNCLNESVPSHWVLMTKDVYGGRDLDQGSLNKNYAEHMQLLQQIGEKTGILYTVPSARDALVAIVTHYVYTQKRLLGDPPLTYTRCKDIAANGDPIAIGGFNKGGITIATHTKPGFTGLALARLFSE